MGVGPDGPGSVRGGFVPVPGRSPAQYSRSGSGRSGPVETVRREESHSRAAAAEPEGCRRPSLGSGGRPDVTQKPLCSVSRVKHKTLKRLHGYFYIYDETFH